MMIALHKNARTTPAIRAEITSSTASATSLAQRFGVTEATVYKWKKRTSFQDCSHTAHRLQTTLSPAQERVVVELRRTLLLPLMTCWPSPAIHLRQSHPLRAGPLPAPPWRGQPQCAQASHTP